jgi:hypothetical protein
MNTFPEYPNYQVPDFACEKLLKDMAENKFPRQYLGENESDYFDRIEAHYGFRPTRISGEMLLQKLTKGRAEYQEKLQRIGNRENN